MPTVLALRTRTLPWLLQPNLTAQATIGLSDGSVAGDFPLERNFWVFLTDSLTSGWTMPSAPFTALKSFLYWSSTTYDTDSSWFVTMATGGTYYSDHSTSYYVWPVRSAN
jgi:hypothetical protein